MTRTNNKQMREAYQRYVKSESRLLRDVYTSWSDEKQKAFNKCFEVYNKLDGRNYRIIGANTFSFSFGFICEIDNKKAFVYITKDYIKYMYI